MTSLPAGGGVMWWLNMQACSEKSRTLESCITHINNTSAEGKGKTTHKNHFLIKTTPRLWLLLSSETRTLRSLFYEVNVLRTKSEPCLWFLLSSETRTLRSLFYEVNVLWTKSEPCLWFLLSSETRKLRRLFYEVNMLRTKSEPCLWFLLSSE